MFFRGRGTGGEVKTSYLRPMQEFRKSFLPRCDILLRGDQDKEVYTEYPHCYCRTDCLSSGLGFESVAIGFFWFLFPHFARSGRSRVRRIRMCG